MAQSQLQAATAAPQQLRAALAVALAERKDSIKASEAEWKRKALAARSSLLRVSKAVKHAATSDTAGAELAQALLPVLPEHTSGWARAAAQVAPASQHVHIAAKAGKLQSFMDSVEARTADRLCALLHFSNLSATAVQPARGSSLYLRCCAVTIVTASAPGLQYVCCHLQVINALADMREGRLSRIWVRQPLPQLLTALEDAIMCLPASRLRTQYLHAAAQGLQYLADDGVCRLPQHEPCTKVSALQGMAAVSCVCLLSAWPWAAQSGARMPPSAAYLPSNWLVMSFSSSTW